VKRGIPSSPPLIYVYIYIYISPRGSRFGSNRQGRPNSMPTPPTPHHPTPPHPAPPHPTPPHPPRGVTNLNQNGNQEKQEARRRRFNDESAERQRERKQNRSEVTLLIHVSNLTVAESNSSYIFSSVASSSGPSPKGWNLNIWTFVSRHC
jgi:hypothetical protein